MSGLRYEVWSADTPEGVKWYARARDLEPEQFDTEEDALEWARAPEIESEPDFTDPNFVTGAVWAQIEDLSMHDRVAVLRDILNEITDPLWHLQQGHSVTIWFPDYMTGYVQWVADEDTQNDGYADLYDAKGGEAGETEGADCRTCEIELRVTEVLP